MAPNVAFLQSRCPPVGAGAQQMSLVSCAHQLGPQAQLAISASGGNCSRVHREAPPLHFFWIRTFPLEFLGSEGTYVTLVVSRAHRRHFRGPYQTGKQKNAHKKCEKNVEIFCVRDAPALQVDGHKGLTRPLEPPFRFVSPI